MNVDLKTAVGTVRISTGKHTSDEDIETATRIISEAVKKLSL
jgi:cysteine sulfinate desulfinase/cysteine desulfurase-like protein